MNCDHRIMIVRQYRQISSSAKYTPLEIQSGTFSAMAVGGAERRMTVSSDLLDRSIWESASTTNDTVFLTWEWNVAWHSEYISWKGS